MEPTRPARVGFRGDSGFGGDKPLKWPEGLLHLLWQGQGDSPLRGDLEGQDGEDGEDRRGRVLPPAVGQLAHQVRSRGGGERDVWQGWELLVRGGLASHYVSLKIPRRSHRERGGDCGEKD